jgi:hypothetical protein
MMVRIVATTTTSTITTGNIVTAFLIISGRGFHR